MQYHHYINTQLKFALQHYLNTISSFKVVSIFITGAGTPNWLQAFFCGSLDCWLVSTLLD